MPVNQPQPIHQEDALKYIIAGLRKGPPYHNTGYSDYGYDLYLPNWLREFVVQAEGGNPRSAEFMGMVERRIRDLSPQFLAAAWELSRRGIIRPGVRRLDSQSTEDGSAGCGYSITPFGQTWLSESHSDDFVPTEPERFGRLLVPYSEKFGQGFRARAQEAVRCYGAHAYLACCAMCGAAPESILLALAIAKTRDEASVLKDYRAANGRSRVENLLLGQARQQLQIGLRAFSESLKYWRDESAHGLPSAIKDDEAYTSLAMVLRFAQFATDNWAELTGSEHVKEA